MDDKSFEDELGQAFEISGRIAPACDREDAFRRVGRFQLKNFNLGSAAAVAEIVYFPSGSETVSALKEWVSMEMSWGLDQLRLLINELPKGEEQTYLKTVEDALSTYSWLQWAIQDTGSHMLPDADLGLIGRRTKEIMEKLQPIRNGNALILDHRKSPKL
jgi:hypothetical protein